MIYLSEPDIDFTGGHTEFPGFDLHIRAPAGSGVFWRTGVFVNNSFICHPFGIHAGRRVDTGIKFVGNGMLAAVMNW
jgi:hypothetical protein